MSALRVAAIQHDIVWHDREANFERLAPRIAGGGRRRRPTGAADPRPSRRGSLSTRPVSPNHSTVRRQPSSARVRANTASGLVDRVPSSRRRAEPGDDRPSNSFVLAGPDGTTHRYSKIHPFSHAGEEQFVRPGSEFVTVDIDDVRLTLFVCYDLRFADEFWARATETDAYVVIAELASEATSALVDVCCGREPSRIRHT